MRERIRRHFASFLGGAVCGALCFGLWPEMWKSYGIIGGVLAAIFAIGITWYMNHWLGVIENSDDKLWIDQGWACFASGVTWGVVRFFPNSHFTQIFPTLTCCLIGGLLGGWAAHAVLQIVPSLRPAQTKEGSK